MFVVVVALAAMVLLLGWAVHRLRKQVRANVGRIEDAADRLEAIDKRIRTLGIVDAMISNALAPSPRPVPAVVDMEERRRRGPKGLLLLPLGWIAHEIVERPAVAAAAVGVASLGAAGMMAWEPPEEPLPPDATVPERDAQGPRPPAPEPGGSSSAPEARGLAGWPTTTAVPTTLAPPPAINPEAEAEAPAPQTQPTSPPATSPPTTGSPPTTTEPPGPPEDRPPEDRPPDDRGCRLLGLDLLGLLDACI